MFFNHLQENRGTNAPSRNVRLAAIHSFFRYAALQAPDQGGLIERVLAIPSKRYERSPIAYLNEPEIEALLAAPRSIHVAGAARSEPALGGVANGLAGLRTHRAMLAGCHLAQCPSLEGKRVSPHALRHSAAMALLHSGVDCAVIALWLGHESNGTFKQCYIYDRINGKRSPVRSLPCQ